MPITFNTNLAALGAQRNIGIASNAAGSSLAKLSSGSRVPTAKDDAAALAVGSKLKADVAGLTQASNNAAQAISLLQIADGALSTVGDMLQRMKALSTQASSGQLGNSERALLNQEFTNLRTEIDRIASTSNFNGTTLLNGGDVVATQTGVRAGFLEGRGIQVIANTAVTAADEVFRVSYDYTANADPVADIGNLTVTNQTTGASQTINVAALIKARTAEPLSNLTTNLTAGDTVDVNFSGVGVTLRLDTLFDVDADVNANFANGVGGTTTTMPTGTYVGPSATLLGSTPVTGAQLASLGAAVLDPVSGQLRINVTTGVNTVAVAATAGLEFSRDNVTFAATLATQPTNVLGAQPIFIRIGAAGPALFQINQGVGVTSTAGAGTLNLDLSTVFRNQEVTTAAKNFSFKVGTGVTANDNIGITVNGVTTAALGVSTSTIDTAANADLAITAINAAITTISSRRADIGASQSRLEFADASIKVSIENTTAATSALMDVDVSSEITNFTSKQVLLQAGVSLLAQANQQPALLLRLLQ
jgi:flagellin